MLTPNANVAPFNLGTVWIPRRKGAEAQEALANVPRPRPDPVAGRVRMVSVVVQGSFFEPKQPRLGHDSEPPLCLGCHGHAEPLTRPRSRTGPRLGSISMDGNLGAGSVCSCPGGSDACPAPRSVIDQTDRRENGIWTLGSGSTVPADTPFEGMLVRVNGGRYGAGLLFCCVGYDHTHTAPRLKVRWA